MTQEQRKTTHFGYREVAVGEKTGLVHEVFESVAGKYDLMNDLISRDIPGYQGISYDTGPALHKSVNPIFCDVIRFRLRN